MKKELENLSQSDEKVRQMLASLKRVDAPKDFEFRLKARIAKASPETYRATSYKRRLAYALPAFASIVVSTFVVLNGNFFGGENQQVSSINPTTAQTSFVQSQSAPDGFVASSNTSSSSSNSSNGSGDRKEPETNSPAVPTSSSASRTERNKSEEAVFTAVNSREEKPKEQAPRRALSRENDGFSTDIALTPPPKVYRPKGLNPDAQVEPPKDFNSEKPFSVQELLSPLGVEVTAENGKWKVKNVSANSAAERSGIKADDVIETLDGQKLSAGAPLRGKKIEVKKLGVKRGGAQVEINLQTSPK